ncbi:MAG TPA: DUF2000 domain-containing protein [Candidatus Saccharimonadia bacterium]
MDKKCVIIVDGSLPAGIIANAAACLGFSLGSVLPDEVGPAQVDASGTQHGGLLSIPIPILTTDSKQLHSIVASAYEADLDHVYDMSEAAQSSKTQQEYGDKIQKIAAGDMKYWAVACYGPKKTVNKLCGSLPLYRG